MVYLTVFDGLAHMLPYTKTDRDVPYKNFPPAAKLGMRGIERDNRDVYL